jgi:hypothetical protein
MSDDTTEARYDASYVRWDNVEEEYETWYELPKGTTDSWHTLDDVQAYFDTLKAAGGTHDDMKVYDNWSDEETLVVNFMFDRTGFFGLAEASYIGDGIRA